MRRWFLVLLAGSVLLGAVSVGYRVLGRDYRYFQLVKLGDELLEESLPFQASRTYGSAMAIKPDEAIAYIKRAEAEQRQGNSSPAIADLEHVARLSSDVLLISLRLAELYYEVERFDEAAAQYEKALELDPSEANVLYKLALVRFRGGREAEALDALNRAAALRDGFWEAYFLRGAVFRALGGLDEAEADFLRALTLRPEAKRARTALIDLYIEDRQADKALALVRDEIDANPEAPEPYLHLADVHAIAGRNAEAIEAVGLALEQNPDLPVAYLRLGELWLEEATIGAGPVATEKAVVALESVVKMDPANGRAALTLGRAYLAMDDEARGFAELKRATQATPIPAEAHRLLGDLYRTRKNHAEAVTAYHVYLKLRGDTPAVLERLGDTYIELNNPSMAAEAYLKLASLEPGRVTPLVKAARSQLASGDPAAAVRMCRRGLATNPENHALLQLLSEATRRASS